MVLDTALLNTKRHKVRIKGIQEWSSAIPYTSVSKQLKWKPSVALDYSRQLYNLLMQISSI